MSGYCYPFIIIIIIISIIIANIVINAVHSLVQRCFVVMRSVVILWFLCRWSRWFHTVPVLVFVLRAIYSSLLVQAWQHVLYVNLRLTVKEILCQVTESVIVKYWFISYIIFHELVIVIFVNIHFVLFDRPFCERNLRFSACFFFFICQLTFFNVPQPTFWKLFHMTWLQPQRKRCCADFLKVPRYKNEGLKPPNFGQFRVLTATC